MAAGLVKTTVASSAAAAPPAKALPSPLLCTIRAKPDAAALPDMASKATTMDTANNDCLNSIYFSQKVLIKTNYRAIHPPYRGFLLRLACYCLTAFHYV